MRKKKSTCFLNFRETKLQASIVIYVTLYEAHNELWVCRNTLAVIPHNSYFVQIGSILITVLCLKSHSKQQQQKSSKTFLFQLQSTSVL